jgi:hypothetical protein
MQRPSHGGRVVTKFVCRARRATTCKLRYLFWGFRRRTRQRPLDGRKPVPGAAVE